jgi:hypothetical protein
MISVRPNLVPTDIHMQLLGGVQWVRLARKHANSPVKK